MIIRSLTDHRVDVQFAEYISEALKGSSVLDKSIMIVTNGMIENANQNVLQLMKDYPSLYLNDDNVCWVPTKEEFPLCEVLTQFSDRPYRFYQISKLAIFDPAFDKVTEATHQEDKFYWGSYRPERYERYRDMSSQVTVIGNNYPQEFEDKFYLSGTIKDWGQYKQTMENYRGHSTYYFGNPEHDGISVSYRLYEALMYGMKINAPYIDLWNLLDNLELKFVYNKICGITDGSSYPKELNSVRERTTTQLVGIINGHLDSLEKGEVEEVDSIAEILGDRGTIYGSYSNGVECRATILGALVDKHKEVTGGDISEKHRIVYGDLALKLMRAAGAPNHKDSWLDLAGYSKLIYEMIEEDEDALKG